MFKKILIANRGEIACRVIRSARAMGIETVAVYSDADKGAPHMEMADEAVHIGPPKSAESYLVAEKIVQACKDTGAEAVHPGYGFLSENAKFVAALDAAGIAFIGPRPHAIEAMGDKIGSKKLAEKAGVNVIPGHTEAISDPDEALGIADDIGYPVMLKASAGGGGKGMRIARSRDEVKDGLAAAQREAASSFGDDRVFIEKYVEQPRHIEIQVLADGQGTTLYLHERECSIQRRHQKVIEEAPSPFLDPATRKAMGEQAVALAEAVDYVSAGTVEFIMDKDKNFYFLEMNTRLQVEHPVTEMITGLDLAEWMIRIAAGEKLPFGQADVKLDGWAMETRVYAEDPIRGFLPSTGRLTYYTAPDTEVEGVRVDTGVRQGGEISMFYDPMIAKLITWGRDRDQAAERMRHALDEFLIRGIAHNIPFLSALMKHPRFVAGDLTTNFIDQEYPDGFTLADVPHDDPKMLVAVATVVHQKFADRDARISGQVPGQVRRAPTSWVVTVDGGRHEANVLSGEPEFTVEVDGQRYTIATPWTFGEKLFHCTINGERFCVQVEHHGPGYRLIHAGMVIEALVVEPRVAELMVHMPEPEVLDTSQYLLSPMPGVVVAIDVQVGQEVKAGYELCVIEAMKMEMSLKAERDGVIEAIHAKPGDSLAVDQAIIEFREEPTK